MTFTDITNRTNEINLIKDMITRREKELECLLSTDNQESIKSLAKELSSLRVDLRKLQCDPEYIHASMIPALDRAFESFQQDSEYASLVQDRELMQSLDISL